MRAILFQRTDLFMALHYPKISLKDHGSFANKSWEGFGGQVKEDEARIWPEPVGERKMEKENRCLTFQSRKKKKSL